VSVRFISKDVNPFIQHGCITLTQVNTFIMQVAL